MKFAFGLGLGMAPLLKGVGVPYALYLNGYPVVFNGFYIVKES